MAVRLCTGGAIGGQSSGGVVRGGIGGIGRARWSWHAVGGSLDGCCGRSRWEGGEGRMLQCVLFVRGTTILVSTRSARGRTNPKVGSCRAREESTSEIPLRKYIHWYPRSTYPYCLFSEKVRSGLRTSLRRSARPTPSPRRSSETSHLQTSKPPDHAH